MEYKDENGKQNISSAIRFLMQKGYETLYKKKAVQIPYNKSKINKDEIKKEVINEVMSEMNTKLITNLTNALNKFSSLQNISINTTNAAQTAPAEKVEQKVSTKKNIPLSKEVDKNSFLANILNNANR